MSIQPDRFSLKRLGLELRAIHHSSNLQNPRNEHIPVAIGPEDQPLSQ